MIGPIGFIICLAVVYVLGYVTGRKVQKDIEDEYHSYDDDD